MKKSYALIIVIIFLFGLKSSAQESIIGDINYGLLEKYIQAAKEYYPKRKTMGNQEETAKIDVTLANISYLDIFNASYFYRPNDKPVLINGTGPAGGAGAVSPYTVNGIQYGISLNLGAFLQKPFLVKRAKTAYKLAKLQSQDYDISLVSEVKKRYYTYVQTIGELKLRTQTAQDNKSVADNMRRRFEKGEITLDVYNTSRMQLADANTSKIQNEVNYLSAKDALEEIIGMKLSEVK